MRHLLRTVIISLFIPLFFSPAYGYGIVENKILEFQAYTDEIYNIFFSNDEEILYTCGLDEGSIETFDTNVSIKAWNSKTGEFLETIHTGLFCDHSSDVQRLLIRIGTEEGTILWDIFGKNIIHTFPHSYLLIDALLSSNGQHVYTAGAEYLEGETNSRAVIKIWDTQSGELLNTNIRPPTMVEHGALTEEVIPEMSSEIYLSPDEKFLFVVNGYSYEYYPGVGVGMGYAELINLNDWQSLIIFSPWGGSDSCCFSPDKKHLVVRNLVYDLETLKKVNTFSGASPLYNYSPNGRYALGKSNISDWGTIWDADTGNPIVVMPAPLGYSTAGAWSPDGSKVAIGGWDGTITVWDVSEFVESSVGEEAEEYEGQ